MLQQPANQQHIATVPLPRLYDLELPVVKQSEGWVWLNKTNHPLVLTSQFTTGRLVKLLSTEGTTHNSIILNKTEAEFVVVQATNPSLVYTSGKLLDWWAVRRPKTEWVNKTAALIYASGTTAIFQAICICPTAHKAGLVAWSLYYQASSSSSKQEIARGNDLNSPGVCTISLESHQWKAGFYTLKVNRLQASHLVVVKSDSRTWEVKSLTNLISVGYALDYLPPLYLN